MISAAADIFVKLVLSNGYSQVLAIIILTDKYLSIWVVKVR